MHPPHWQSFLQSKTTRVRTADWRELENQHRNDAAASFRDHTQLPKRRTSMGFIRSCICQRSLSRDSNNELPAISSEPDELVGELFHPPWVSSRASAWQCERKHASLLSSKVTRRWSCEDGCEEKTMISN